MMHSVLRRVIAWGVVVACLAGGAKAGQPTAAEQTRPTEQPPAAPTQNTPASAEPDVRFDSPSSTMATFLEAMELAATSDGDVRTNALSDAIECFDGLSKTKRPAAEAVANQLLNVLNKIEEVHPDELPDARAMARSRSTVWVYFPRQGIKDLAQLTKIAGGKRISFERTPDGRYLFSKETIEAVRELARRFRGLPAPYGRGEIHLTVGLWVRQFIPVGLQQNAYVGLEPWQWAGLAVVIFVGFVIDLIVRMVLRKAWRRIMIERRGRQTDREVLRRAVRPFGMFFGALVWLGGLLLLDLPETPLQITQVAAKFVLMLAGVLAAYRVTDLLAEFFQSKAAATHTKIDDLLIPLLRKTAKVLVTAMGVIYIADSMDIEILPLLTGLGIGGLAFAFAAKDTIENFFGSIAVIADRPFEVGDWVVIGDTEGTIEELGLRSTRIRTFYNSVITVPNSTLVRASVDNYGRRRYRRFKTMLSVTYSTTPEQIEAFCAGVRELIRAHPYTRKDYFHVWLNGFGAYSLDILLYMFHECPDWSTEVRERHRFMLDVIRLADRLGVEFAFPTQTLHLDRVAPTQPGHLPEPKRFSELRAQVKGQRLAIDLVDDTPWYNGDPPPPVSFGPGAHLDDLPPIDEDEPGDESQTEQASDEDDNPKTLGAEATET